MRKASLNTRGFGLVAVLLVVVVLAIIGGSGVYVYHKNHKTEATTSNSRATSTGKGSSTTQNNTPTPTLITDKTIFKIPELGVEIINVPESIQDLTDKVAFSDANNMDMAFSTSSLTAVSLGCSASHGGVGTLARTAGTYPPSQTPQSVFVKQFSDFWIGYAAPSAPCDANSQNQALWSAQRKTFGALVTDAANVEAIK